MIGTSPVIPIAPSTSRAERAMSSAMATFRRLASETRAG
jgi:hypothetical protein